MVEKCTEKVLLAILVVINLVILSMLGVLMAKLGKEGMISNPNYYGNWWMGNRDAGSGLRHDSVDNTTNSMEGGYLISNISQSKPNDGTSPSVLLETEMADKLYNREVSAYLSTETNQENLLQEELFNSN